MTKKKFSRPSKDEYYLEIAKAVARRGTCLVRRYGAIIVKNDVIVSTGYTGAPRKVKDCLEWKVCPRMIAGARKGENYELCISVHSEENAIINAARHGASVLGGKMYIYGEVVDTGEPTEAMPCERCRRAIINAGIEEVIIMTADRKIKRIKVKDWIKEEEKSFLKKLEKAKELQKTKKIDI